MITWAFTLLLLKHTIREAHNFRTNATADKVALNVRQGHAMSMLKQHRDYFSLNQCR